MKIKKTVQKERSLHYYFDVLLIDYTSILGEVIKIFA